MLSPLLFNLFIDDLIRDMNFLNIGIEIEDEKICILLRADDIIFIMGTVDLQSLLSCLNDWSARNGLKINIDNGLGAKWRYVGYFGSSLHPREEKFGCYHGSKACLGDLKSHVVLSYQWQVFCK